MLIITYIMGHTLTIHEDTLHDVLAKVKLTDKPPEPEEHTSPRLANRQLKFFFSLMRNRIYEKVLNQQQQTFHASRPKEATWLVSFCAMLGFAMVLEEIQRTIQIQADAKIEKLEMTPDEAYTEALHACERIDDRFGFLVAIFRQKYRDKKWRDTGSFGPGTPTYGGFPEKRFLGTLRGLAEERSESRHPHLCGGMLTENRGALAKPPRCQTRPRRPVQIYDALGGALLAATPG